MGALLHVVEPSVSLASTTLAYRRRTHRYNLIQISLFTFPELNMDADLDSDDESENIMLSNIIDSLTDLGKAVIELFELFPVFFILNYLKKFIFVEL